MAQLHKQARLSWHMMRKQCIPNEGRIGIHSTLIYAGAVAICMGLRGFPLYWLIKKPVEPISINVDISYLRGLLTGLSFKLNKSMDRSSTGMGNFNRLVL